MRDESPKLSFQCSRSQAPTSRTPDKSLAHLSYQWLPPLAIFRVCSGLDSSDSYRDDVVVGLNGGFLHTAQLGANCLNGTGRGDLDNASTATRKPHDRNTGAHEGAAAMETRCIFIAVSGFAAY